ncbi:methionyl-tRNA formyltransferase [Paenibacillus thermoaerophilus]
MPIRVVFMGTIDFSVPSLKVLLEEGYEVVGVVTQPDRPRGRKRELTPPPVKVEALKHGLDVFQPERLRTPEAVERVREMKPDLIVTAAYGQILPKSILTLPKHGCINVHASLLPRYRGGAPIHYAVMNGDPVTGVTIMYMAEGLDTGDMISRVEVPIGLEDTTGTMFEKLAREGAELLRRTLPGLLSGQIEAVPQREEEATYAPNITRADEELDWTRPAVQLFNRVRGLNPFPGAFTYWKGHVLKIWASTLADRALPAEAKPGEVLAVTEAGIDVATGDGVLRITELQPSGKRAMNAAEFSRGGQMAPGDRLGERPS